VAPEDLRAAAIALARTRAASRCYARVKAQLRGDTVARTRHIVATASDPMLSAWL